MNQWQSADDHAQRAHQHFESGQWELALEALRQAVQLNPHEGEWHFGMGLALDALKRFAEATECYERALKLRGQDDIEVLLHLGVDLIHSGQPKRAIERLERVSELDPACEQAYCHRIAAYTQLGQHEQAELMFYLARQVVEECPMCYSHIAQSLAMRGCLDRAIWCWRQVLRIDPHFKGVYGNLARAHWQRGQLEQAHQLYLRQLRQSNGQDPDTLLQLGMLLSVMQRYEQARQRMEQAWALNPSGLEIRVRLAELALQRGDATTAQGHLNAVLAMEPRRPGVHLLLAQAAQLLGQATMARAHLRSELSCQGHEPSQSVEMASRLLRLGEAKEAERLLGEVIDGSSTLGAARSIERAYLLRGSARLRRGDWRSAIGDLRRASRGGSLTAREHSLAFSSLLLSYAALRCWPRAWATLRSAERKGLRPEACRRWRRWLVRRRAWSWLGDLFGVQPRGQAI